MVQMPPFLIEQGLQFTLQETNISPKNGILKMIFLFPRWDMLIPWRVPKNPIEKKTFSFPGRPGCITGAMGFGVPRKITSGSWAQKTSVSHTIHGTGIFTYIWLIFMVNVGKYTIHGWYGFYQLRGVEIFGDDFLTPCFSRMDTLNE